MVKSNHINLVLTNVSSFENFFKQNYQLACMVASRYIKNSQQAEDIVQETFINIWQKRNDLKIHSNLKQYLLNSVRNNSINFVQRVMQMDDLSDESINETLIEENIPDYSNEEISVKIAQSIENLPPQCKKIFLLAYKENLTYNEIAATLNLSKNTIKTQMGIAYKLIRQNLKNYFTTLIVLPIRNLVAKLEA